MPANEVHVWHAALDLSLADLDRLQETLAPEERARASRFRFAKDRSHFIAARGVLRDILAQYLCRKPSQLRFCYSSSGKPALASDYVADDLRFNLSHSHGLALLAFTRMREVGVDVERLQPHLADEKLAEGFFSRNEVYALRTLPLNIRREAFFHCWTLKEAYVKARGEGLQVRLSSFDVPVSPGESACVLGSENSRCSLLALKPAPDYVAAVAVEGHNWHLRLWKWLATAPTDVSD